VVEKGRLNSYRLTVWDWEKQSLLFSRDLEEFPLDMTFSPRGNFLAYSKTSWESMTFIDADTGRKLYYMDRGFGIVSGFAVSPSERTLMTYSPSGSIQYREVRTGTLKTRLETVPNLSNIEFSKGLRYMAASGEDQLLLIDLVSGKTVARYPLTNIESISINSVNNKIACYTGGFRGSLYIFTFTGGNLLRQEIPKPRGEAYGDLLFTEKILFAAGRGGEIYTYTSEGLPQSSFSQNKLLPITGIDFQGELMVLASENEIITFESDFFTSSNPLALPEYLEATFHSNPLSGASGITAWDEERFILWKKVKNEKGKSIFIHPRTGQYQGLYEDYSNPLISLDYTSLGLLTLQENGIVKLINPVTLTDNFEYNLFGLQDVIASNSYIMAGKNRDSGFPSSLVRINPDTGETLPLKNDTKVIYKLAYNSKEDSLLTLGLEDSGPGTNTTVLEELTGGTYQFKRTLYTYPGEDLNASVVVEPETGEVYTSLGFSVTKIARLEGFYSFEQKERIPRDLFLHNTHLYSLNEDDSITVWGKNTGKKLMDFFIFRDKNWVALLSDGRYYSSSGADEYISVYLGTRPYRGSRNFKR
jgi:WD40 repeat protein